MKAPIALALSFAAVQSVFAVMSGPMYPPTNGVMFSFVGDADSGAGRTNTYTGMSMDGIAARWWGDDGTPIINSLSANPNDVVHLDLGQSDLTHGVAIFTGTSNFTYLVGTNFVTVPVQTRFTLATTDLANAPVPMIRGLDLGIVGAVAARVDANDFHALLFFEARNPLNGVWTPTRDLFNSFHTSGTHTLISFGGGFYEEPVPPCPADFNQDGGVDGSDVNAFFSAWEGGDESADVNQDGGVDGSDVNFFFAAWEAGGC